MMELPGREKSLVISLAISIQYLSEMARQTDGHRLTTNTALTYSVT